MAQERTARMRLAELVLGQPLDTYLIERRAEGDSFRKIARDMRDATNGDVDITEVTLRSWCARLDVTSVVGVGA